MESCWRPGSQHSQCISSSKWATFQEILTDGWAAWAGSHGEKSFCQEHEPAVHAYNYGQNVKIELYDRLYAIPRGRQPSQGDEDKASDDEESEDGASRGANDPFVDEDPGAP